MSELKDCHVRMEAISSISVPESLAVVERIDPGSTAHNWRRNSLAVDSSPLALDHILLVRQQPRSPGRRNRHNQGSHLEEDDSRCSAEAARCSAKLRDDAKEGYWTRLL